MLYVDSLNLQLKAESIDGFLPLESYAGVILQHGVKARHLMKAIQLWRLVRKGELNSIRGLSHVSEMVML
jgi:hypothetical protein